MLLFLSQNSSLKRHWGFFHFCFLLLCLFTVTCLKAQEHWLGALLRSGPAAAQCGFPQVQHEAWCIFFQLHPAFHPLSAHRPLHCVSLVIHSWAVCACRPWKMSLWHAGFTLSLPASPNPKWVHITLQSSWVSNAPAPGNRGDTWDH